MTEYQIFNMMYVGFIKIQCILLEWSCLLG